MFEWSDVHVFLAVSRRGSFTAAARDLKLDQTTVGRRVAALEARLGTRLFRRGRDGLVATPAGRDLVPAAEEMERAAGAVALSAAGRDRQVEGPVRLTTIASVAEGLLAPAAPALLSAHPGLLLDLHADDRSLSLTRREADLAIRAARPPAAQPSLVARRLARVAYAVYGPRRGARLDPARAPFVGFDDDLPADLPETRWLGERGARVALRTNQTRVMVAAVAAGVGLALLPCYIGDGQAALARVVAPAELPARELWLIVHPELARTPRLRAVIGWVEEVCAAAARALAGG